MLVFSYKQRIEQIWDGWLTVSRRRMLICKQNTHRDYETEELLLLLLLFPLSRVPVVSATERVASLCCQSNMLHRKTYTRWFVIRW